MAGEIHNYQNEALTFGDDDFYDIDFYTGTGYETKKIKGSTIKNAILNAVTPPSVDTLYTDDGELEGNRTVNGVNSYSLLMTNLTTFGVDVIGGEGVDAVVFNVPVNESLKSFVIVNSANQNPMFSVENGYVCINDKYKLPLVDGANGEVLSTDGAGNLFWTTIQSPAVATIYSQDSSIGSNRTVNGTNYELFFDRMQKFAVTVQQLETSDGVVFNVPLLDNFFQFIVRDGKQPFFHIKNGQCFINDTYSLPTNSGTNGQILTSDGAGVASWQTATGGGGMQTGTMAQMLALTGQSVGTQFYNTTVAKVFTWSDHGVWFVNGETMIMQKTSQAIQVGMLMIPLAGSQGGAEIALSSATNQIIGINVFDVEDGDEFCVVAYAGMWDVLCSDDTSYTVGEFLVHDGSTGEDGQAKLRSTGSGHMGIVLEDKTVPTGGGLVLAQVQTTERY